jgi:hypothetical protein
MGYFSFYMISAVAMVACLAIGWVVTGLLHLSGAAESVVRMLLMGLVFAGFGALFYLRQRKQTKSATDAERAAEDTATSEKEIGLFVRDAEHRLAASSLGKEARLSELPIYLSGGRNRVGQDQRCSCIRAWSRTCWRDRCIRNARSGAHAAGEYLAGAKVGIRGSRRAPFADRAGPLDAAGEAPATGQAPAVRRGNSRRAA